MQICNMFLIGREGFRSLKSGCFPKNPFKETDKEMVIAVQHDNFYNR